MENKKLVKKEKVYIYIDMSTFEGTLEQVAKNVLNIKERLKEENVLIKNDPNKYESYEISIDSGYRDDSTEINIHGIRHETDEEYENRLKLNRNRAIAAKKAATVRKNNQEKKEKELYEQLKKKFKGT